MAPGDAEVCRQGVRPGRVLVAKGFTANTVESATHRLKTRTRLARPAAAFRGEVIQLRAGDAPLDFRRPRHARSQPIIPRPPMTRAA